ncbi:hypothetical protein STEG23_007315 [Scotinomys teguina]
MADDQKTEVIDDTLSRRKPNGIITPRENNKSLAINPTTLMPDDDTEEPIHDYLVMLDIIHGIKPDLTNVLLTTRVADLYMDVSSFIQEQTRSRNSSPSMFGYLNTEKNFKAFQTTHDLICNCKEECISFRPMESRSNNGLAFKAKLTQLVYKALNIN